MRLIVGIDSFVGQAVAEIWSSRNVRFRATTRRILAPESDHLFLDLKEPIQGNFSTRFSSAVLLASVSDIAKCEKYPEQSYAINVKNTVALAKRLSEDDCFTIFISSSAVFDGHLPFRAYTDQACPITTYGMQKVEAERAILSLQSTAVLRLTKVENLSTPLLREWYTSLSHQESIYPYNNVYLSPLKLKNVIAAIDKLISGRLCGLHQLGGTQELRYSDYAYSLCKKWGFNPSLIHPIEKPDIENAVHESLKTTASLSTVS